MAKHAALPPASALRRVVRARLGGLLPVTAPTPQYHNLERWPAAALSLNYQEGAAMLPSGAATPGLRSQARARDRLSITGLLYAVAPPRREESLSLIPLCRMPSAVCRSPISQTPAWGSATAATAAALALQKRVCLAERDLHHGGPACTLSSSLGGRLKCCCYCDCCRSLQVPSSMSDPGSSFPVCCKYFPTSDVT
jgi:hypothetical protein